MSLTLCVHAYSEQEAGNACFVLNGYYCSVDHEASLS